MAGLDFCYNKTMSDKGDTYKREQLKKVFLKELASDRSTGNVMVACTNTGCTRKTMYEWRKDDPTFARDWDDVVLASKERLAEEAENMLRKMVLKGNPTCIIFTLKNMRPSVWKDRYNNEDGGLSGRSKSWEEYVELCKQGGINPDTGLRINQGSSEVEENKQVQE